VRRRSPTGKPDSLPNATSPCLQGRAEIAGRRLAATGEWEAGEQDVRAAWGLPARLRGQSTSSSRCVQVELTTSHGTARKGQQSLPHLQFLPFFEKAGSPSGSNRCLTRVPEDPASPSLWTRTAGKAATLCPGLRPAGRFSGAQAPAAQSLSTSSFLPAGWLSKSPASPKVPAGV